MRAVVCEQLGDPLAAGDANTALRFTADAPSPPSSPPPPGHVRVRISAASLNFADLLQVAGKYQDRPKLPFIVGSDFSGVVVAAGEGVPSELRTPGTRVCGVGANKAFAEEAVVPAAGVWRLPDGVEDLHAAAGVPVAFGTADLALRHRARLQPGQTLLVLGASGGVGAAAVQIGRLLGARVVAVARGADKARFLREDLGAHAVVDTSALPSGGGGGGGKKGGGGEADEKALCAAFKAALKQVTSSGSSSNSTKPHPPTADVVFDNVGGSQFSAALRCASWGAHLLAVGFASGAIPSVPANLLLVKNATLHGVFWGAHLSNPQAGPQAAALLRGSVGQVLSWVAEGKLSVPVSARLPLERVREAAALMAGRKVMGKVLLIVDDGGKQAAADTAQGEAEGGALVGGPPPYPRSRL